ncbi:MAG: hypothetical protein H6742_19655 [Alphaproteobacteria bacterium]|nr:hypothetical protein [Alphaproteobacteria bacterium]
MTRSLPFLSLVLSLGLAACSGGGGDDGSGSDGATDDGGGSDGGGGSDDGGGGGAGPDGQANVDNPSTGYDYFVAFGYRACELYEECTPEEAMYLSYEDCIANVDLAASYYDLSFSDCTFDAAEAAECWQLMEAADCGGYDGGDTDCSDDVWVCP